MEQHHSDLPVEETLLKSGKSGGVLRDWCSCCLHLDGDQAPVPRFDDEVDLEAVGVAEMVEVVWCR